MPDDSIEDTMNQIEARYRVRFSGHPRVSRDPEELTQMLADLDAIATEAEADAELSERLKRNRTLYTSEREAVNEARAAPGAIQAHRQRLWADLCIARYKHHFANQPRSSRDVSRLADMRRFLGAVHAKLKTMHAAAPHLQLQSAVSMVSSAVSLYTAESERIRTARLEGDMPTQGTRLATLANAQFEEYRQGFAGKSRLSRSISRLERILSALEELAGGMSRLARSGFASDSNNQNLALVTERRSAYRAELGEITKAQSAAELPERVNALSAAANQVFGWYREEFAGASRATRDLQKLDVLYELLWPIATEMDTIDQTEGHETNERNLSIVLDNLLLYTREFDAIVAAQADA